MGGGGGIHVLRRLDKRRAVTAGLGRFSAVLQEVFHLCSQGLQSAVG